MRLRALFSDLCSRAWRLARTAVCAFAGISPGQVSTLTGLAGLAILTWAVGRLVSPAAGWAVAGGCLVADALLTKILMFWRGR